ncbi:MAG: hypothetical protein EXS48_01300 [Candidatus Staskawiczbacteria bacterium]|nr:hypothetical protein [Candidatus Staskawiczbacteria bacterium]
MAEKFSITTLVNNDGCFDLQFRKDTRHERTGSPTYYRWKIQFIVTSPKDQLKTLEKAKKIIGAGNVSLTGTQARFSVQKIDDIIEAIIPFFTKNKLSGNKKRDFDLWQKAVDIIFRNKGIYLSKWSKNDLLHLMEIHKAMAKYKLKPRKQKWSEMAKTLTKKET